MPASGGMFGHRCPGESRVSLPGAVVLLWEMPEGQGWAGLPACSPGAWSLAGGILQQPRYVSASPCCSVLFSFPGYCTGSKLSQGSVEAAEYPV